MALSDESQRVLATLAAFNSPPIETMEPVEARADRARHTGALLAFSGPEIELPRIEDRRVKNIPARVYWPSHEADLPALVYFHGGGWVHGTLDLVDGACRAIAKAAQCVVVSVDYRLAPEHKFPAPLEDAFEVTRHINEHPGEFGIDPRRIAVGGDSAGGNLAASCTLIARDRGGPDLAFQLLIYPITDRADDSPSTREYGQGYRLTQTAMRWYWRQYLQRPEDGDHAYASPFRASSLAGLPPAFVITAECDPIRDEGEKYATRLAAAGVPVRLKRYEGAIHGFFLMRSAIPAGAQAIDDAAMALREVFSPGEVDRG